MKCLEKNRLRRYESAHSLDLDLRASMEDKPVEASPPSTLYRTRKFILRHRVAVGLVGAVSISLVVGLILAIIGFTQASRERDNANKVRAQSEALVGFIMQDLQTTLQATGRRDGIIRSAQEAVRHFEQLPPETRTIATIRGHAMAYKVLQDASDWIGHGPFEHKEIFRDAAAKSAPLWRQVAEANPEDVEALAEALFAEAASERLKKNEIEAKTTDYEIEVLRQLKELEERFPDNYSVQLCIIRLLRGPFFSGRPFIELSYLEESRQRAERLAMHNLQDDRARAQEIASTYLLGRKYYDLGETELGLRTVMSSLAIAQGLLEEDPTHWGYLILARQVAETLTKIESDMAQRMRWISRCREILQTLIMLNPEESVWYWHEARKLYQLANIAWQERQFEKSYQYIQEAFSNHNRVPGINIQMVFCHNLGGRSAARTGNLEAAMVHLVHGKNDYDDWVRLGENSYQQIARHYYLWQGQLCIYNQLQDWPSLEDACRTMIGEYEPHLIRIQNEEDRIAIQTGLAEAQALLGRSLVKQGRDDEALLWLEMSVVRLCFGDVSPIWIRNDRGDVYGWPLMRLRAWEAAESLGLLCQKRGNYDRAFEVFEWWVPAGTLAFPRRPGPVGRREAAAGD